MFESIFTLKVIVAFFLYDEDKGQFKAESTWAWDHVTNFGCCFIAYLLHTVLLLDGFSISLSHTPTIP